MVVSPASDARIENVKRLVDGAFLEAKELPNLLQQLSKSSSPGIKGLHIIF
jgi:hypothetical protein